MAKRKRVRERATSLEAMESKRKLRLIFLAFAAMSSYMQGQSKWISGCACTHRPAAAAGGLTLNA